MKNIVIKGAREHNLKNISVTIPRGKLVVITGVSGSGKSTLAFDTLYAEGQRRYVESLSSYARQFLGVMDKPDVDSIEGLSPAISIEQKTVSKNPRSTVGTTTEIYDYLRLLFARIGESHCPTCGGKVVPQTPDMITDAIMRFSSREVQVIAPVVRKQKGTHQKLFDQLSTDGFSLVIVNGEERYTDDLIELDKNKKHSVSVLVDQLTVENRHHVSDAVQTALNLSKGSVVICDVHTKKEHFFTSHSSCVKCLVFLEDFEPRHFSFNSPFGACEGCSGLGVKYAFDEELIIPDPSLSIADGGIKCFRKSFDSWRLHDIGALGNICGFTLFEPISKISKENLHIILHGLDEGNAQLYKRWKCKRDVHYMLEYEGVIPLIERLYQQTESEARRRDLERFMRSHACAQCNGQRLKPEVLAVRVGGKNIAQITEMSISTATAFFESLVLGRQEQIIAQLILKEIKSRLAFLDSVGLGYLNLARSMETLSGGEAQRIRLATQIGSNLMGVVYVLDEPSIGLHQRDNAKLLATLKRLRDLGNTIIVVEHDEDTIRAADHVIDIGPGAGRHGGSVVAHGTADDIARSTPSITGAYLRGDRSMTRSAAYRKPKGWIKITGARENNLKNIDVRIPTGVFVAVTGVSGSGKSTLVNITLARALMKKLYGSKEVPGKHDALSSTIRDITVIDQAPIGRTPRSNPATYTKMFDGIRTLFARTREAKVRGYKEGRFSFNVQGGRCAHCEGDGTIKIEMNFLPDVYVTCDVCSGRRYNKETLEIFYKGKNIYQVLEMTVEEALSFFSAIPGVRRKLQTLYDVGLGYITLGQSATTLSGGEAQRIKLSRELSKVSTKDTLYLLDEPTTGLHFDDVNKLLAVLNRLVDKGATCLVIEHNLDVIKNADYIIDLGPEGGDGGGEVVAAGTPRAVARVACSYTGSFLKDVA